METIIKHTPDWSLLLSSSICNNYVLEHQHMLWRVFYNSLTIRQAKTHNKPRQPRISFQYFTYPLLLSDSNNRKLHKMKQLIDHQLSQECTILIFVLNSAYFAWFTHTRSPINCWPNLAFKVIAKHFPAWLYPTSRRRWAISVTKTMNNSGSLFHTLRRNTLSSIKDINAFDLWFKFRRKSFSMRVRNSMFAA